MENRDRLLLFTSSFPFGKKETYLEKEILFLAKNFREIEIYPYYYNQKDISKRNVPSNVFVHNPAFPISKFGRINLFFKGIFQEPKIYIFFKEFFRFRVYKSNVTSKRWLFGVFDYISTIGTYQFKKLKEEKNGLFYFYWGIGWSYSLLSFKDNLNNKYFVRLHGGDTYLERSNGYLPVRQEIFKKANFLLPISDHLKEYIHLKFSVPKEKIFLSRLGVDIPKMIKYKSPNSILKIVSCSNLIPLKRVSKILEAIKILKNVEINWTHFGDGPDFFSLKSKVNELQSNTLVINLLGRKSNEEILDFYKNNEIDAFVNVSKHEGVPVSIMEAMSFGIPCIATDAGATSELVNNKNGILLNNDFKISELAESLKNIHSEVWIEKRVLAYRHCSSVFNSKNNYEELVKILNLKTCI